MYSQVVVDVAKTCFTKKPMNKQLPPTVKHVLRVLLIRDIHVQIIYPLVGTHIERFSHFLVTTTWTFLWTRIFDERIRHCCIVGQLIATTNCRQTHWQGCSRSLLLRQAIQGSKRVVVVVVADVVACGIDEVDRRSM